VTRLAGKTLRTQMRRRFGPTHARELWRSINSTFRQKTIKIVNTIVSNAGYWRAWGRKSDVFGCCHVELPPRRLPPRTKER
jgi:hypothetical protein